MDLVEMDVVEMKKDGKQALWLTRCRPGIHPRSDQCPAGHANSFAGDGRGDGRNSPGAAASVQAPPRPELRCRSRASETHATDGSADLFECGRRLGARLAIAAR